MDFLTIAQATSSQSLRRLIQTAAAAAAGEDDDFSHLDTSHTSHHDLDFKSDSILDITTSSNAIVSGEDLENSPMLSPAAEAELFMLATNFLLYIAIILIITMVCKIYFPEALERNEAQNNTKPASRNVSYRRVIPDEGIKDDVELFENSSSDRSLYEDSSFDEDFSFIAEQQALVDGDLTPTGSTKRLVGREKHDGGSSSVSNLVDTFAFEQEQTSRKFVIKRLLICIISLNVTFVIWGVLQERMLTRRYPRYTGEFFTYSYALVFTNRFWTLIMSTVLMIYFKPKRSCSTVIY
jgi:hypothetical protein